MNTFNEETITRNGNTVTLHRGRIHTSLLEYRFTVRSMEHGKREVKRTDNEDTAQAHLMRMIKKYDKVQFIELKSDEKSYYLEMETF